MHLEVRVFSGLEKHIPGARFGQPIKVNITEHFTCRMLLDKLNIPEKEVFIVLVNGVNKALDDALADGDRISLFPPVGGG
ncbi:ThiS family protein [Pelotomaculum sp. FP]|uniref:MoaD/ThiS family protein n=1 Tax=Pelotomaculum sp. FP TaxID=261474 RepID=UPI00106560BC|nr:MoaD/ThiS family protein [Pelotomaculum sp. FP]TEB10752.1 ThiS family protein [Pelotomaculum sp. FP]